MKQLTASAPGKLVLLGEYAVLEGAPALVLAVDRRAQARIVTRPDGICTVSAPDLDVFSARMSIAADGALQWQCDSGDAAKLSLVEHVWQNLLREGLAPQTGEGFDVHLDTSGFFHVDRDGARAKLGLGSSAALTVALASALAVLAGHAEVTVDRLSWIRRLFHMHGGWQGGRGSGVDVAASVAGGLIAYQLIGAEREPSYVPLDWSAGLHARYVWSGQSVSTNSFLQRLAQWRATHQVEYVAHMGELRAHAEAAMEALRQQRLASFIGLTKSYASALQNFGAACGLEIYTPAQKRLADMATHAGISYKPCGAGGDFGVVFADDAERLATFDGAIVETGMQAVPLRLEAQGLGCHIA